MGDEDCKILMYRAMIAQDKFAVVKGDISSNSPSSLQAVKLLAEYSHNQRDREGAVAKAKQLQGDGLSLNNPTVALMVATIFFQEGDCDEALRCLYQVDTLEAQALAVQILLSIHRLDLAKKTLKKMQGKDEDATLTQLATAWANLAIGGDKLKDAFYTFQELAEKFNPTPLLLNGKAAALIQQGEYLDAEEALLQAQDKDPNNPDTLVNLYVVSSYLGKSLEIGQRYLNQLRDSAPNHPFVKDLNKIEQVFDTQAQQHSA